MPRWALVVEVVLVVAGLLWLWWQTVEPSDSW